MSKFSTSLWLLWWQSLSFCLYWYFSAKPNLVPCTYCWGRCSVNISSLLLICFFSKWLATVCWHRGSSQVIWWALLSTSSLANIISELCFRLLLGALLQEAKILHFLQWNYNFSNVESVLSSLKKGDGTNEWWRENKEHRSNFTLTFLKVSQNKENKFYLRPRYDLKLYSSYMA